MTSPTAPQPATDILTLRQAWIEKGRPADPTDPYWASVLKSQSAPSERKFVAPLVIFGGM